MPVVEVHAASQPPTSHILRALSATVEDALGWRCWVLWRTIDVTDDPSRGPVVLITCKDSHGHGEVRQMAEIVRNGVASITQRRASEVFVAVRRVIADEVLDIEAE